MRKIAATPKSRPARRLRRFVFAAIFVSIMTKKMRELRWGQYVETSEHILLSSVRLELPANYLDALVSCPLPPGWIASVLPIKVRQQIETYAKNKLVTLMTPLAKKRAHRSHVLLLRDQLGVDAPVVTDTMLRKLSPMFDSWSSQAIDELIKRGRRSAYRQGMWIHPPSKKFNWDVNGMVVLHGTVGELVLQDDTGGALHQSLRMREHSAPTCFAETRHVLATPSTVGYIAKTNVLLFEFDYRDIRRLAESMSGTAKDKHKRFVAHHRALQLSQTFQLRAEMLQAMKFFSDMAEPDLHLIAQAAKPRVAFERDVVVASGSLLPEIIIVCRGQFELTHDGREVALLDPHDVIGPDFLVFEDRCPLSCTAVTESEYWVISAAALHGVMKNTIQRKHVVEAAARMREYMMTLIKDDTAIGDSILESVPHVASALRSSKEFRRDLVSVARPQVFKAGDRLVSAGDDMTALIIVTSGRIHKLQVTNDPGQSGDDDATFSKVSVPCVLGENFMNRCKWAYSLTASRVCEAWVISRVDVWRLVRGDGFLMSCVRSAMQCHTSDHGNSSPHVHAHTRGSVAVALLKSEAVSANEDVSDTFRFACDIRAERRTAQKQEHEAKAHKLEEEAAAAVRRSRKKLAPNISGRVPFVAYEGLHPVRPSPKEVYEAVRNVKRPVTGTVTANVPLPVDGPPSPSSQTRRSSQRASGMRVGKLTVKERLEEEIEEQSSKNRRHLGLSGNSDTFAPHPPASSQPAISPLRRSTTAQVQQEPNIATAEKMVLKMIMAQHDAAILSKRLQAHKCSDALTLAASNPFSSIEPHAALYKLSPTGELFRQVPGSKTTKPFNAKAYQYHCATSYLSAHAFSDL